MDGRSEIDICERKHGGNAESKAAFSKARRTNAASREAVLLAVAVSFERGLTAKEYAEQTGRALNAISGRFSELKRDGRIMKNGARRDGCAAYVAV